MRMALVDDSAKDWKIVVERQVKVVEQNHRWPAPVCSAQPRGKPVDSVTILRKYEHLRSGRDRAGLLQQSSLSETTLSCDEQEAPLAAHDPIEAILEERKLSRASNELHVFGACGIAKERSRIR